jgi:hypothetical protein
MKPVRHLTPDISLLQQEYVLVQAFKKTVGYIRYHNWFADVLELDLATVDFPSFLEQLQRDIKHAARWRSGKARLVPAPKSGEWQVTDNRGWEPKPITKKELPLAHLRPLAHIPLRDQVAATALMLCLADSIETKQGDPRLDVRNADNRKRVINYGNRLFCDTVRSGGTRYLRHRWGSGKLYRSYYADYRTFVTRPEIVAAEIGDRSGTRTVIVQSDLSKFYDRVRPKSLLDKLKSHLAEANRPFLNFAKQVLSWEWDNRDVEEAVRLSGISDFQKLALPQGLVSAGFFANVFLLDFDDSLRDAWNKRIARGITLRDAARYVDDLRFVVEVRRGLELDQVKKSCHAWIESQLEKTAPGLKANLKKTHAVAVHDPTRVMVTQSRRMHRIQETVSGGFDAHGGTQLLAALEGLFNTIGQFVETDEKGPQWPIRSVPDVRDETVARFVAGRYRSTFRSLRPLLEQEIKPFSDSKDGNCSADGVSAVLTKEELDRQSQAFALRLIEEWIRNPGNVRLLRIGLDLFPHASVLESVVGLLKPIIEVEADKRGIRAVAEYCVAEIFRAAATETGIVPDGELLPADVDIEQYHDVLRGFARQLMGDPWGSLSWFCQQQILQFFAVSSPVGVDVEEASEGPETATYASLLAFLQGRPENDSRQWATKAVLARRSFMDADAAWQLIVPQLTAERLEELADLAPCVAEELLLDSARVRRTASKSVFTRLSLPQLRRSVTTQEPDVPLVNEARQWNSRIRDESSLLRIALAWLEEREGVEASLPPMALRVSFSDDRLRKVTCNGQRNREPNPLFCAPDWSSDEEKWRFELGLVLRFAIVGRSDPAATSLHPSWREHENCYRPPEWHWKVRRYSLFNGRDRLGPEWIPFSSWMESFLTGLLHWPGSLPPVSPFRTLQTIPRAKSLCRSRLRELESERGKATGLLMLAVTPRLKCRRSRRTTPLRLCVAQMAVPEFQDGRAKDAFGSHDPELNAAGTRHVFRRHLTAMLAGIDQMLRARATHLQDSGLDLLVLPELAVHPEDVRSRLLPFARKHRCWVFTGLTYHRCHPAGPLVNSGLWIIPESAPSGGVFYRLYEQGKKHLAPEEATAFPEIVRGHRDCQWLLRWRWSDHDSGEPLILTGSICYDATDLALAADLKDRSDVYVIAALNRDVGTFDRMTEALHYHMYQMVILANHAHFGGSNAYLPYRESHHKQVFHLHGQDEAILAFYDIPDPGEIISRGHSSTAARTAKSWKTPPADWNRRLH